MKKNIAFLTCILTFSLLLGMLAGCSNNTPDAPPTQQSTESDTAAQPEIPDLSISLNADHALVQTSTGLTYTAKGYDAVENQVFRFEDGLVLSFDQQFTEAYNRFTMKYFASAPMKITISYTEKDEPMQDTFYLEAGEHEFRALNHKFFQKVRGNALVTMQIDTCEDKNAEFILRDLFTEDILVLKSQQYIEGSRYTLGVELKWGGAIHSLEDKECPLADVTNLVNMHDEGRLIQQSYYGVFYYADKYEEGGYLYRVAHDRPKDGVQPWPEHGTNPQSFSIGRSCIPSSWAQGYL